MIIFESVFVEEKNNGNYRINKLIDNYAKYISNWDLDAKIILINKITQKRKQISISK